MTNADDQDRVNYFKKVSKVMKRTEKEALSFVISSTSNWSLDFLYYPNKDEGFFLILVEFVNMCLVCTKC